MFPIPENIGNSATTSPNMVLNFASTTAQFIDPRVTFTRTQGVTNPVSTYYNSAGVLSYAGYNLLKYSQTFQNAAWSTLGVGATDNATAAPDGTTTAATIAASAGSNSHYIYQATSAPIAGSVTFTIFVKAGTYSFVTLNLQGPSSQWLCATINASTGVVTKSASGGAASLSSAVTTGPYNGFYRVALAGSFTTTPQYALVQVASSGTPTYGTYGPEAAWTAAGTETIYAWGAQLEQSSTANTYAATTAAASGAPRFDYDPVALTPKGLLIEETRTNLLTYSQDYTQGAWGVMTVLTLTTAAAIAPDNTNTGSKMSLPAGAGQYGRYQTYSYSAGAYTMQMFAKAGTYSYLCLDFSNGASSGAVFNLSTGVVGYTDSGVTATIKALPNSWYLCSITKTMSAGTGYPEWYFSGSGTANVRSFTAAGTENLYLWGAQLEAGAFATSYIPTTSATVQRGADNASMTGTNFSSWYNATQGTIYIENSASIPASGSSVCVSANDGVGNSYIQQYVLNVIARPYVKVLSGGVTQAEFSSVVVLANQTIFKSAISYALNNIQFAVNATGGAGDLSATIPTVNQIQIGSQLGSSYINGAVKTVKFYASNLSLSQIQGLTK